MLASYRISVLGYHNNLTWRIVEKRIAMLGEMLKTAEEAARAAGAEAVYWFEKRTEPREKGFRELVTEGDVAAQRVALEIIQARFPDHHILAEEDNTNTPDGDGVYTIPGDVVWIIDPVDGTTNFSRHVPFFNVSIGVAIDGQPAAGVVYDPIRDTLFAAVRGQGATLDGRPIHVAERAKLADALIAFDSPPNQDWRLREWAVLPKIAARCRTLRALGSAALGMAYVAAGSLDAYLHYYIHPWDVAVGALLVEEAGGVVRQTNGEEWRLGQPSVLMCNSALLDPLLEIIAAPES
jgi:myo-inositol-1(or 4)-monophosphatase